MTSPSFLSSRPAVSRSQSAKKPSFPRSYAASSTSSSTSARRILPSFSSIRRKSGAMPSAAACSRASDRQSACTVVIFARCTRNSWRRRRVSRGLLATAAPSARPMRSRISAAAALVKVTSSRRSMSTGSSGSVRRVSTRSTSTAVLPEPAAAETSSAPPRLWIAVS